MCMVIHLLQDNLVFIGFCVLSGLFVHDEVIVAVIFFIFI